MDWLEQELKQALARKEPDPGFEDRVRRRKEKRISAPRRTHDPRVPGAGNGANHGEPAGKEDGVADDEY